ncbi:MAG: cobalamin-dependent protein [Coriobacteriia bacterium]|nr:cobalamin-dependent protein [Coriobacteriia bacterium]
MADESPVALYRAFVAQDPATAIKVVERVRTGGVSQVELFDTVFAPALALLGASWATGDIDEIAFTQASVVADQISSFVTPSAAAPDTGVTVLVGCIQRDRHAVMKNIVGAALKEAGNRVIDLGVDVRPAEFLEKVEETGARIVVVFAEIMTTARAVGRVRDILTSAGHGDVVLLACGGPFEAEAEIAKQCGANGVVRGAESGIRIVAKVASDLGLGVS